MENMTSLPIIYNNQSHAAFIPIFPHVSTSAGKINVQSLNSNYISHYSNQAQVRAEQQAVCPSVATSCHTSWSAKIKEKETSLEIRGPKSKSSYTQKGYRNRQVKTLLTVKDLLSNVRKHELENHDSSPTTPSSNFISTSAKNVDFKGIVETGTHHNKFYKTIRSHCSASTMLIPHTSSPESQDKNSPTNFSIDAILKPDFGSFKQCVKPEECRNTMQSDNTEDIQHIKVATPTASNTRTSAFTPVNQKMKIPSSSLFTPSSSSMVLSEDLELSCAPLSLPPSSPSFTPWNNSNSEHLSTEQANTHSINTNPIDLQKHVSSAANIEYQRLTGLCDSSHLKSNIVRDQKGDINKSVQEKNVINPVKSNIFSQNVFPTGYGGLEMSSVNYVPYMSSIASKEMLASLYIPHQQYNQLHRQPYFQHPHQKSHQPHHLLTVSPSATQLSAPPGQVERVINLNTPLFLHQNDPFLLSNPISQHPPKFSDCLSNDSNLTEKNSYSVEDASKLVDVSFKDQDLQANIDSNEKADNATTKGSTCSKININNNDSDDDSQKNNNNHKIDKHNGDKISQYCHQHSNVLNKDDKKDHEIDISNPFKSILRRFDFDTFFDSGKTKPNKATDHDITYRDGQDYENQTAKQGSCQGSSILITDFRDPKDMELSQCITNEKGNPQSSNYQNGQENSVPTDDFLPQREHSGPDADVTAAEEGAKGENPLLPEKPLLPAWVFCTRYSDRPSSGPKSRKHWSHKAHKSKHTRATYTHHQLQILKREFEDSNYLTEVRQQCLAEQLGLTARQIKIWFQNRRAKIKRNVDRKNPLALKLMEQGLYNHKKV